MENTLIIDGKINKVYEQYFINKGFNLIKLPSNNNLYDEISSHTDILLLKICNSVVVEPTTYEKINISNKIVGSSTLLSKYPDDIKYNVCIIGKFAIHNFKYTDKKVLEILEKNGYEKIDISQGYSNCAIAKITDNACITSDKKIASKLREKGIDVLVIKKEQEENIKLLKNNLSVSNMHGFIGGAIAKIEKNIILFGDKKYLKDSKQIEDFIKKHGCKLIDFKQQDILDYGGIVVL